MYIVKSVGVMSVAKIMGLLYACLGLLVIPFVLLGALLGAFAGQNSSSFAGIVGVGLAILAPFLYGALGFIFGALGALLYNLIARWVGGFELEMTVQPEGPVAPYPIIPATSPNI
jgi:hypothetical protein